MSAAISTAGGFTLPLSASVRKAYEDLYDATESAIEATADPALLQTLNDVQLGIGAVISADNKYQLDQNTALFEALDKQVCDINEALKKLQDQIAKIAKDIERFGNLAGQIQHLLSMIP